MEDFVTKIVQEVASSILAEKQRLIQLRIEERVKQDVDLVQEAQKRFPRIVREFHSADQSEHYYWNDGSEQGMHLISFFPNVEQSDDYKFKAGFNYR